MFYAYDELGSVAALSNHQGKLKTKYLYDAFGEVLAGDLSDNQYAFTGQRLDPESGLYHFHFRKYDVEVGVWTTADPIGILGGVNLYQYVSNNPGRFIDNLGMYADDEGMTDLGYGDDLAGNDSTNWNSVELGGTGPYCDLTDPVDQGVYNIKDENGNVIGIAVDPAAVEIALGAIEPPIGILGKLFKVLNPAQLKNAKRFLKKIPSNSKDSVQVRRLPSGGVAVQATSKGRVQGSRAVYEKQISASGKTQQCTKTTYDPQGNIVHVKDKITHTTITK